jgi:hypothetical protein
MVEEIGDRKIMQALCGGRGVLSRKQRIEIGEFLRFPDSPPDSAHEGKMNV